MMPSTIDERQHEIESERRAAALYARSLIEASLDPLVTISPAGKITDVNAATEAVTGRSRVQLIGTDFSDYFTEPEKARAGYRRVFSTGFVRDYPLTIQHADGGKTEVLYNASVYRNEDGVVQGVFAAARDVTARNRAAHLYTVLSMTNEAIVRAHSLPELYEKVCRIAVEVGQLRMAWVGMIDENLQVVPVAHWGLEGGYLGEVKVTVDASSPLGMGPTGRAIRENLPQAFNDWEHEHDIYPWRESGFRRGYRSSAAFPLNVQGKPVGALMLYAGEKDFFTADEMTLLETLGNDLAFAIESVEREEQRRKAEELLLLLNAELEKRIQDRTAQLVTANRELEAFTYSVSHDLRTPLRAIDGFSGILLEASDEIVVPRLKDYLQRIRNATGRMAGLIDDLLSLSRVSRLELHAVDTNLSEIATETADTLRENDPRREVEFVIAPDVRACADAALMRIVLENLMRNAWKFTSKRVIARIEFGVSKEEGRTVYFVRDDGAGFDPRFTDKLFVPFQRLHSTSEFEGSGIGLAIVHRVISRHGGSVWATSEPGSGATFYFTLEGGLKEEKP